MATTLTLIHVVLACMIAAILAGKFHFYTELSFDLSLCGSSQVGDEITHINNRSVVDALHRDVIQLMQDAGGMGEVTLRIRRKMPWSASKPSYQPQGESQQLKHASQTPLK